MSFKIDGGLFKFDFTDYHAILGAPVDANIHDIRKRYLKIARCLHPDSCSAQSPAEKDWANQLLSKLVNPAYKKLSQNRSLDEYMLLLTQMGKRLKQESAPIELKSELSKQLAQTSNIAHSYKTSLNKLALKQYDSFDNALQLIAEISELNLVYLMHTADTKIQSQSLIQAANQSSGTKITSPPPQPESFVAQYLRRAQELMAEDNLAQAGVELQEALKLEPNNSRCHTLIGVVYLKQNRLTMAKVHFERALKLNPKDEIALAGKGKLDTGAGQPNNQRNPLDKFGGVFGGLFGGKKK